MNNLILFRWLFCFVLCLCASIANASSSFITIHLKHGVSVDLPGNWHVLSDNQRKTLSDYVQSKTGSTDADSELNFAANYYDDNGNTAAIFNIRYYPEQEVTQSDSDTTTEADIKDFDEAIRAGTTLGIQRTGGRVLSWRGTKKQHINGIVAFVTEYRRASIQGGYPFRTRLIRVLNAERSFTVTVSYREDQGFLLRKICDRIIQSIRM